MGIAAFSEERFPTRIGFGASGGPERRIEIVRLSTGFEHRNQRHAHAVRRYDVGTGVKSLKDLQEVIAFFEARRGRLVGFRFRDPFDWHTAPPGRMPGASDVVLGTGDGARTRFDLLKRYGAGEDAYVRPIAKAVPGSVKVGMDGAETLSGIALDPAGGSLLFDEPPAAGARVTAGFAFDVPVRFDIDHLAVNAAAFDAGEIPTVPLIEVRP